MREQACEQIRKLDGSAMAWKAGKYGTLQPLNNAAMGVYANINSDRVYTQCSMCQRKLILTDMKRAYN